MDGGLANDVVQNISGQRDAFKSALRGYGGFEQLPRYCGSPLEVFLRLYSINVISDFQLHQTIWTKLPVFEFLAPTIERCFRPPSSHITGFDTSRTALADFREKLMRLFVINGTVTTPGLKKFVSVGVDSGHDASGNAWSQAFSGINFLACGSSSPTATAYNWSQMCSYPTFTDWSTRYPQSEDYHKSQDRLRLGFNADTLVYLVKLLHYHDQNEANFPSFLADSREQVRIVMKLNQILLNLHESPTIDDQITGYSMVEIFRMCILRSISYFGRGHNPSGVTPLSIVRLDF